MESMESSTKEANDVAKGVKTSDLALSVRKGWHAIQTQPKDGESNYCGLPGQIVGIKARLQNDDKVTLR